ncbi:malonyl-CoA-(acyl-carrier-protein) transacylase [Candidatus Propionivibrio aalborgensis]|uniref:Malonyl CoA-acyl carrier protein transacylase n=1 Tax=Candidatus Propionivibrio aalborgensis TaxID=1860101 RepID=A0A1A8Y0E2_9RHOO|nr:ACP S-malonyltransferase [Candidatus Propionivibrio aalborgensis]MBK7326889.1 ACP S-malonyltransferase [Propionivibrio sp.]MBK7562779.1 ACP S-malonyltransferase [Propionivibrio sp.]MBK9026725.1 ACP S-malonyltransferase [Propionivibrio sp.]SBT10634.1 malonyl-CoA-(acyl-carrier-protein) transacylase [Candidatus Propionivibrio aalborgensis]HRC59549.1 ACP S-malonyltransferase [Candidatus Propionivibrio aalborgensis]
MAFAFVFPGQGSQSVGMMAAYGDAAVVRATFDEASATLGQDLWELLSQGPAEALAQTVNTQPVMLTAGIATYRLWLDKGGRLPAVVAGHSLGEYSALVAAGVIDFRDAVPLVRLRAAAMQEAVPVGTGAMAAIMNLDDDRIQEACAEAADEVGNGEVVERVNFNAPGQTVIAGSKAAVERACEGCKARGAKRALLLPVSAPFHSSLIRPAAVKLGARLAELNFAEPKIQVVNNVDVAIESDPARIKDALIRQAFSPVRWVETIQKIASIGITTVAECGPGKVLAGLTKRCSGGLNGLALADLAAIEAAIPSME